MKPEPAMSATLAEKIAFDQGRTPEFIQEQLEELERTYANLSAFERIAQVSKLRARISQPASGLSTHEQNDILKRIRRLTERARATKR